MSAALAPAITGVHPYAAAWPLLSDAELAELAESIATHGLQQPIVVTPDGEILDGRNRAAACEHVGVTPAVVVYDGDDLAEYVIAANATRRHMSTGARAMASAVVLAADGRRRDGRWRRDSVQVGNGDSSTSAWIKAVQNAGLVLDHAPDLAERVVAGDLALDAAHREALDRRDAERRQLEEAERLAAEEADARAFIEQNAPDLAQQVGGPFQTFVEALAVWEKRNREEAKRRRDEEEAERRREAERKRALTDLYSGMARALRTCAGYGGYTAIDELMGDFAPQYLDPPQYEREFTVDNLQLVRRFADLLIQWQERRRG